MSTRRPPRPKMDWSQVKITRGAMVLLALQIGISLVWLLADLETRGRIGEYIIASPSQVLDRYRVWTLATSPLLEVDFLALLLNALMLWMLVPQLERFWGTKRFVRFVAITSIAGTVGGVLMGRITMQDVPIVGLAPFTIAAVVAFGTIYAQRPVQFFGVLPLTSRQFMWGFLAFTAVFVLLQGMWERGASFGAAIAASYLMTSKQLSPGLAYKRWQLKRKRAKLSVLEGGVKSRPAVKKSDERFIN